MSDGQSIFMIQASELYRLQEIDLNVQQRHKRLEEIAAQLADNKALTEAQQQVKNDQQTLTPLQSKVRKLEADIQSNTAKLRDTDETLYSGRVRNPKELQDMQNEIQSLKKRNQELEDVLLETMISVDTADAALKASMAKLETIRAQLELANKSLIDEQKRLKSEGSALLKTREQLLPTIDPNILKVYNNLRPRKNNQPVAVLVNESCSVCRVQQDRNVIQEVRKSESLTYCSSCGRILIYRTG
jgi:predicted  nucleic acid-binding Zn-ribbon protein